DVRWAGNRASPGNTFNFTPSLQVIESDPVIRSSRVLFGEQIGIDIDDASPVLDQVHVEGSGNVAVRMNLDADPTLTGLTAAGNAGDHVQLVGGTLTADRTLNTGGALPIHLTTSLTVGTGATLTLVPGTVVKAPVGEVIVVDGTLNAPGTAGQPIVFTATSDDAFGGDSNSNGSASAPVPGSFESLRFNAGSNGSVIEHILIRYAGNRASPGNGFNRSASLEVSGGAPVIRHTRIEHGENAGIEVTGGTPVFDHVHVEANGGVAVDLQIAADPVFTGLTATGNGRDQVRLPGGTLNVDRTFDTGGDLPLHLTDDLAVSAGAVLSLVPGTVIKVATGQRIGVSGTLIAQGTAGAPIIVTAESDDTAGGDSNDDGDATVPVPGSWESLDFEPGSAGHVVEFLELRWAGNRASPGNSFNYTAALIASADVTVSNVTVRDSNRYGALAIDGATITINDGLFIGNEHTGLWADDGRIVGNRVGVFSSTWGVLIDSGASAEFHDSAFENNTTAVEHEGNDFANAQFQRNWWGDAGGPDDPSAADGRQNLNPLGQPVSDFVAYDDPLGARPPLPVGPLVVEVAPSLSGSPIASIDVRFSELIDLATLTGADVTVIGPQAASVTTVAQVNGSLYRLDLDTPLAVDGDYTIEIGPDIRSLGSGYAIDQDRDGVDGEDPDDVFSATVRVDTAGSAVIALAPDGVVNTALSSVDVTFSEPIDATSFAPSDVTLTGPQGAVQVLSVVALTDTQLQIIFPVQFVNGIYDLTVGPEVSDLAGNPMNQNGVDPNGEDPQDVFTGSFEIDREPLTVVAQDPSDLVVGGVETIDVTFSAPINGGSFTAADVTVIGDEGAVTVLGVAPIGGTATEFRISVQRITREGAYTVRIGPEIADTAGILMDGDLDNRPGEPEDRHTGSFTVGGVGPQVVSTEPSTVVPAPVSSITAIFSESIAASSFSPVDVELVGPQGGVAVTRIAQVAPTTFSIEFPAQTANGQYTIFIGPFVTDEVGVPMDQDGDSDNGEPDDDVYRGTFMIDSVAPTVTAHVPSDLVTDPFSLVSITFNEPIATASFTTDDVQIVGPAGPVAASSVTAQDAMTFDLALPLANLPGLYQFTIGPNIVDGVGNPMNEDGDGVFGEANDAFSFDLDLRLPDLVIENVDAPTDVTNGEPLTITWDARNAGTATATQPWEDRVVLTSDTVIGNSDDVLLGTVTVDADLPPGATAPRSVTADAPFGLTGTFNIVILTDRADAIEEGGGGGEDNNAAAQAIEVQFAPPPADLVVDVITVPSTAETGQTVTIAWRVLNAGTAATPVTDWSDRLYLSDDAIVGGDLLLGTFPRSGVVDAGQTYTQAVSIDLPIDLDAGDYRLVVEADVLDQLPEPAAESNNTGISADAVTISLAPVPDLAVTTVSGPTTGAVGQAVTVGWSVTNQGAAEAPGGSWNDRLYLSPDGSTTGAILLGTFRRTEALATGARYSRAVQVTLPDTGGTFFYLVDTDADNEVFERDGESNNTGISATLLDLTQPDLVVDAVNLPDGATALSGTTIGVAWTVQNQGTGPTTPQWVDRAWLSTDNIVDGGDTFLGELDHDGALAPQETYDANLQVALPQGINDTFFVLVVADADDEVEELALEDNNVGVSGPLAVDLAPFADLEVSNVRGPPLTVGDPARVTIEWTVTNVGNGAPNQPTWVDRVIASTDETIGDNDDRVLVEVTREGGLDSGASYSRTREVMLPPAFQGRYYLYVVTDLNDAVFENGLEQNNTARSPDFFDVVRIPYADLVVTDVTPAAAGASGQPLSVSWTVLNNPGNAIGSTSTSIWSDRVRLVTEPDGTGVIANFGNFNHVGALAIGGSYDRTVDVSLPDGLVGTFYVVVETGGPFEFIYDDNNTLVSGPVAITLTPPPDLTVSDITAPPEAVGNDRVDIAWQVRNNGPGVALGTWTDRVRLIEVTSGAITNLGSFTFTTEPEGLAAGTTYSRQEQFSLPKNLQGLFRVEITTDVGNNLFELGATANNTILDNDTLLVTLLPRPDLQVQQIIAPAQASAGGVSSIEFIVINQGTVATSSRWTDRVYLSLDDRITGDDVPVGAFDNGAALGPGEQYRTETGTFEIPRRFRGPVFLIVQTDSGSRVDEHPQEDNNTFAVEIDIIPLPPSDLVTSGVVAPGIAFDGSSIQVTFRVSNFGAGETDQDRWTDTIWLTR
ncbi:MAG: hypothetical protein CMJ18_05695, partial [Phycisphaeraceae bacterium]|nr:hypothetical protein [Phycisphaeraceae bacterium]